MPQKGQRLQALPFTFHVPKHEEYAKLAKFMPAVAPSLPELLHRVFGHREFRAHQQPVCEAAASGHDVLLVMPTGAGKSLCYQLPALARGGTGLVISPLIALMDDQAAKLAALNLRVARIHSGLSRDDARQSCRDYLEGRLDFLFIAPERLRVPGFPEMLAKRKPALVAIDEAHCISQWGHDFRPDYRTLGQHLPALRPSPIIALTATATPTVQQDILRALNLHQPAVFITGFRRDNLQIEVTELSKPERTSFIGKLLSNAEARPAIVYAASRKSAEEIAGSLGKSFSTAAYHAGLDAGTRDRVQRSFLAGKLEVVVATIAFGMGIDKADVRTVIHAALPGSVEAYYQEIGRAGRDGKPSRAILLHSYADRKMHDFFLERDYPAVSDLDHVSQALQKAVASPDELQESLKLEREVLDRCIEKLLGQGAITFGHDGLLQASGEVHWQPDYEAQLQHRRDQIDRIVAFTEGAGCRMAALVRHFGDTSAGARPCGHCDCCNPQQSTSAPVHQASASEKEQLLEVLNALKAKGQSTGKLFADLKLTKDRKELDRLLDGLTRAGLAYLNSETFRADDGRDILFRKAFLTPEGRTPDDAALATVWLRGEATKDKGPGTSKRAALKASPPPQELTPAQTELLEALKRWRLAQAQKTGAPAFTILHDAVLRTIAVTRPSILSGVGAISGIGPEKLDRFGADLVALCRGTQPSGGMPTAAPAPTPSPTRIEPTTAAIKPSIPAPRTQVRPASIIVSQPAQQQVSKPKTTPADQQLETRLRDWRREEATQSGLPTFFILSETALRKVVAARPKTVQDLRTVAELGADKVDRYGAAVVALCHAD